MLCRGCGKGGGSGRRRGGVRCARGGIVSHRGRQEIHCGRRQMRWSGSGGYAAERLGGGPDWAQAASLRKGGRSVGKGGPDGRAIGGHGRFRRRGSRRLRRVASPPRRVFRKRPGRRAGHLPAGGRRGERCGRLSRRRWRGIRSFGAASGRNPRRETGGSRRMREGRRLARQVQRSERRGPVRRWRGWRGTLRHSFLGCRGSGRWIQAHG